MYDYCNNWRRKSMLNYPEVLWLNTNPSLLAFDLPIIDYLAHYVPIGQWEYQHSQDEPSCLYTAINWLGEYLKNSDKPVHLIAHSTSGLLGLMYARQFPHKVKSLTLLGVGVHPAIDWVSYYYMLRETLPCSRQIILSRLAKNLFGSQKYFSIANFIGILESALDSGLSPHSLYKKFSFTTGNITQPLMVCGSQDDPIITLSELRGWKVYLKPNDQIWECPSGSHFFHYFYHKKVGKKILRFWETLSTQTTELTTSQIAH